MPGTMNHRESRFGLNHARSSSTVEGGIPPCSAICCLIERGHDGLGIAYGQASRVGVSPVQDDLDVGRPSALQVGCKVGAYVHRHQRGLLIDGLLQRILVVYDA